MVGTLGIVYNRLLHIESRVIFGWILTQSMWAQISITTLQRYKEMIYEGEEEAISMFENNSTFIGYTHTCSEIRII